MDFPPAPYSVLKIDELRDAVRSMTLAPGQGAQTRLNMTEKPGREHAAVSKPRRKKPGNCRERPEEVRIPPSGSPHRRPRSAPHRERVERARAGMLEAEKKQIQEGVAEARRHPGIADRQRTVAEQDSAFTQQDYDKIKKAAGCRTSIVDG